MNHWLVKQEPSTYPFSRFLKEKRVVWDGVRNYQARNFLRKMNLGDFVLYYHSVDERAVVGLAKVVKAAFPDPTSPKGEDWTSVMLGALRAFSQPVTLDQLKADKSSPNSYSSANPVYPSCPSRRKFFRPSCNWANN